MEKFIKLVGVWTRIIFTQLRFGPYRITYRFIITASKDFFLTLRLLFLNGRHSSDLWDDGRNLSQRIIPLLVYDQLLEMLLALFFMLLSVGLLVLDDFHDGVEFLGDSKLLPTPLIQRILVAQLETLLIRNANFAFSLLEGFHDGVNHVLGRDLVSMPLTHTHLVGKLTQLFSKCKAAIGIRKQRCSLRQDIGLRLFTFLGGHTSEELACVGVVLLLHECVVFLAASREIINVNIGTMPDLLPLILQLLLFFNA